MRLSVLRGVALIAAASLLVPPPGLAQAPPPPPPPMQTSSEATPSLYSPEQLDALLAQIALYPDALLAQILMASTYPLEIVEASRWLAQDNNKALTGDALAQALQSQNWDPSVKSLVPFPQVLAMLNNNLDWTQQLGYAFASQENDVWDSIQRLRAQAYAAGQLQSTSQQTITQDNGAIVIAPADPQVVYVPVYNPAVVYGAWPYPAYPPVYYPPPPGYVVGNALLAGMAFAAGAAIVGSLWGWAGPRWSGGYGRWGGNVNVNVNRYNQINVNRPPLPSGGWRPPPPGGSGGRPGRPPNGPIGRPVRPTPLPANAIGRASVQVPGNLVRPQQPARPGGATGAPGGRPGGGQMTRPTPGGPAGGNVARPPTPGGGAIANRPGGGQPARPTPGGGAGANAGRPAPPGGAAGQRPAAPPQRPAAPAARPATPARPSNTAFGGVNEGNRAANFAQRGAQSRQIQQQHVGGGQPARPQPARPAAPSRPAGGGGGGRPGRR
jgi:hypothetical protein